MDSQGQLSIAKYSLKQEYEKLYFMYKTNDKTYFELDQNKIKYVPKCVFFFTIGFSQTLLSLFLST